jgi:hypothetical protein
LKYLGQKLKKNIITLQTSRFQLKTIDQICIASKSIMPLPYTIFLDSAIFIEKKTVANRLWRTVEFW